MRINFITLIGAVEESREVTITLRDAETNSLVSEHYMSKKDYNKIKIQRVIDCLNLIENGVSNQFTLEIKEFIFNEEETKTSTMIGDLINSMSTHIRAKAENANKQCCNKCDTCSCHEEKKEDVKPSEEKPIDNTSEEIHEEGPSEEAVKPEETSAMSDEDSSTSETKEESQTEEQPSVTEESLSTSETEEETQTEEEHSTTEENPSATEEPKEAVKINLANLDISTLKQLVETTISIEFADLKFSRADIITAVIENSGDSEINVSDNIKKKINVILATLEKDGKIVVVRKFLSKTQPTLYSIVKGSE